MSADRTVLLAAIAGDREAMRRRVSAIRAAKERPDWGMDVAIGDHVGTSIHHWYGGVEGVLERLIRAFEGKLPSTAVSNIRPPEVPPGGGGPGAPSRPAVGRRCYPRVDRR